MPRIAYVNGAFVPLEDAKVSVLDRGFLFADGVYEVTAVIDGKLVDNAAHLARLERSLGEIEMAHPVPLDTLTELQLELARRNELTEGGIYLQVTRGAAERDFAYPKDATPTLVMFTQERNLVDDPRAKNGVAVVTTPDLRWKRRDIKSVAMLAQAMAKQEAAKVGAAEAIMVEDGVVTEGSSSTAWIVKDGRLITRNLSNSVLPGVTRLSVLALCEELGLEVEERTYTVDELHEADEVFITAATTLVMPVTKVDDRIMSNGAPGPIATRLRQLYIETARRTSVG
ncbi:MAG: D-amino-acid transaminase [Devosiaceae bacterium]|nr:D-amino-acid transaminase [Devosiaceae bacterium MH13]